MPSRRVGGESRAFLAVVLFGTVLVLLGILLASRAQAQAQRSNVPARAGSPLADPSARGLPQMSPGQGTPRFAAATSLPGDDLWSDEFGLPVVDGWIDCAVQFQGRIVVGGRFGQINGLPIANVAQWDGTGWSSLGQSTDGEVMALAVFDDQLIVAGYFAHAGGQEVHGVASWSGSGWSPLGAGLVDFGAGDAGVRSLILYQTELIAGGGFTAAGSVRNIARWSGSDWTALGSGPDGRVECMAVLNDSLFVGGAFDSTGAIEARSIARWDGTAWSGVGGGVGDSIHDVEALLVYGDRLIAGGQFDQAGGTPARNLAMWSGGTWSPLGDGSYFSVAGLAEHQGSLFIAGYDGLATWNDSAGLTFVTGVSGFTRCLLDLGDALLVGGSFGAYDADGQFSGANLMLWNAGSWQPPATWKDSMRGLIPRWGSPPNVRALAEFQGKLVTAGAFQFAGDPPGWDTVGPVAQWDGHAWSALPTPPYCYPEALLARADTLYVGGIFQGNGPGYSPVLRIVDTTWTVLDTLELAVRGMAVYQGDLYIGGWRAAADAPRNGGVYRWDGAKWQAVGLAEGAMEFPGVLAMTVHDGKLIAGGQFSEIGGVTARNVAAWDGQTWQPLGSGLQGPTYEGAVVYSLVSHRGMLVASGEFWNFNASLAEWDGSRWQAFGQIHAPVALASIGGQLFAGGWFWRDAGGFDGVMRWDGYTWNHMGSGTNDAVWGMAAVNGSLYLGGSFTRAGGRSAFGVARWDGLSAFAPAVPNLSRGAPNPFRASSSYTYTLPRAGRVRVVVIDVSGRQVAVLEDGIQSAGPHTFTWDGRDAGGSKAPAGVYFVRAQFPDGSARTTKTVHVR